MGLIHDQYVFQNKSPFMRRLRPHKDIWRYLVIVWNLKPSIWRLLGSFPFKTWMLVVIVIIDCREELRCFRKSENSSLTMAEFSFPWAQRLCSHCWIPSAPWLGQIRPSRTILEKKMRPEIEVVQSWDEDTEKVFILNKEYLKRHILGWIPRLSI